MYHTDFNHPENLFRAPKELFPGDEVHLYDGEGCEADAVVIQCHPVHEDYICTAKIIPESFECDYT